MRRNFKDELPVFIDMFEKLLSSNNGGDEYFVGNEASSEKSTVRKKIGVEHVAFGWSANFLMKQKNESLAQGKE